MLDLTITDLLDWVSSFGFFSIKGFDLDTETLRVISHPSRSSRRS